MSDKIKIYAGSAKKVEFSEGGSLMRVNLDLDKLEEQFNEYGYTSSKTGKRYINIQIEKRREPDSYENTHNVLINTFKPGNKEESKEESTPAKVEAFSSFPGAGKGPKTFEDDIPF